jgi:adenylate cyclase
VAEERAQRRLAAILAADVVGYSRLMQRDEAGTLAALKTRRTEVLQPLVARHRGRIVKLMGDGVLIEFASAVDAVECAVRLQEAMDAANARLPEDRRILLRMGINLGDVMVEGSDLYGDGVNIAARLEGLAEPGGVFVSQTVFNHVRGKVQIGFEDLGEHNLKNMPEPVRVYMVSSAGDGEVAPGRSLQSSKVSIAVLPFVNMSGDPEQEYFSDGITEDVITDLSKASALSVIARNTAFTFKGKAVDMAKIARQLNVGYVVEGSVRKVGGRVRITAQLIDGARGDHVWADRYDRDLTDIFAIQDEITHAIVEQLKVKLLPEEKKVIGQAPTESVEAYTYYLRGRQFLHRHSKSYYLLAKRMFAKAVELDPLYARAYAGIADCDSFLFLHYQVDIAVEVILATSAKALDLEANLAEAHASRGLALSLGERYEEAMAEFEEAIRLDSNSFEAHYFCARACFAQGKLERAAEEFERAAEIRPDDYQSLILLVAIYRSLGRDGDTAPAAREGIERAQRELTLHPENPRPAYLGAIALAELGEMDRAREWASRALAIDPDDVLVRYNVSCFHARVGDSEQAIDLLEQLLPHANHETKAWVKHDSDFDAIRSHPRWQKVLALIE